MRGQGPRRAGRIVVENPILLKTDLRPSRGKTPRVGENFVRRDPDRKRPAAIEQARAWDPVHCDQTNLSVFVAADYGEDPAAELANASCGGRSATGAPGERHGMCVCIPPGRSPSEPAHRAVFSLAVDWFASLDSPVGDLVDHDVPPVRQTGFVWSESAPSK